jgi:hypothetical protein
MAVEIFTSITITGEAKARNSFYADVMKNLADDDIDFKSLMLGPIDENLVNFNCYGTQLHLNRYDDEISITCLTYRSTCFEAFRHISLRYPKLIFECFASEEDQYVFDQTYIVHNNIVLIDKYKGGNSNNSFFDMKSEVVNPGDKITTKEGRILVYKELDESVRGIFADDKGNMVIECIEDVDRINDWRVDYDILHKNILVTLSEPNTAADEGNSEIISLWSKYL